MASVSSVQVGPGLRQRMESVSRPHGPQQPEDRRSRAQRLPCLEFLPKTHPPNRATKGLWGPAVRLRPESPCSNDQAELAPHFPMSWGTPSPRSPLSPRGNKPRRQWSPGPPPGDYHTVFQCHLVAYSASSNISLGATTPSSLG